MPGNYFKHRFYILLTLIVGGIGLFLFWAFLFFTNVNHRLQDDLSFFGVFYFSLAVLLCAFIYLTVIGSVLLKRKALLEDKSFRKAFLRMTFLSISSIVLASGIARTVDHYLSTTVFTFKNNANKTIERIAILYPRNNVMEVKRLQIGERREERIVTTGEGEISIKVYYSQENFMEKVAVGYISSPKPRVPSVEVIISENDFEISTENSSHR